MSDFGNKELNDFFSNLDHHEKQAFLHSVEKHGHDEIYNEKDIKDVINKSIKSTERQKMGCRLLKYNTRKSEVKKFIDKNRQYLEKSLNFAQDERQTLNSIAENAQNNKYPKDYFLFAFVIIDDKFLDEKKITLNDAVDSKMLYALGVADEEYIEDESQRNTLYLIFQFLKEYSFQVYNMQSIPKMEEFNEMLAGLASVISFTCVDDAPDYSSTSLHINAVFDSVDFNKKFALYVSDEDIKTKNFKTAYDFYFHNKAGQIIKQKGIKQKPSEQESNNFIPKESRYERKKRLKQEANDDALSMKFKHMRKDDTV